MSRKYTMSPAALAARKKGAPRDMQKRSEVISLYRSGRSISDICFDLRKSHTWVKKVLVQEGEIC